MTPYQLKVIGEALHGPNWRRALARELNYSDRMISFWQNGERPIPEAVTAKLECLLVARIGRLENCLAKLAAA